MRDNFTHDQRRRLDDLAEVHRKYNADEKEHAAKHFAEWLQHCLDAVIRQNAEDSRALPTALVSMVVGNAELARMPWQWSLSHATIWSVTALIRDLWSMAGIPPREDPVGQTEILMTQIGQAIGANKARHGGVFINEADKAAIRGYQARINKFHRKDRTEAIRRLIYNDLISTHTQVVRRSGRADDAIHWLFAEGHALGQATNSQLAETTYVIWRRRQVSYNNPDVLSLSEAKRMAFDTLRRAIEAGRVPGPSGMG